MCTCILHLPHSAVLANVMANLFRAGEHALTVDRLIVQPGTNWHAPQAADPFKLQVVLPHFVQHTLPLCGPGVSLHVYY